MYYIGVRPHWNSKRVEVEVFNELMILVACYHLICFSEFNLDMQAQFNMGYSFVGLIVIVVIVNIVLVVKKQVKSFKLKKASRNVRNKYLKALKLSIELKNKNL
jgi:hypothetical protein